MRTRVLSYSGWGLADFPLIRVPDGFASAHPELEKQLWIENDGVKAQLIGLTYRLPGFDATAGKPQRISEAVMISALFTGCIAASNFVHWRSTEFACPDDQRRFK